MFSDTTHTLSTTFDHCVGSHRSTRGHQDHVTAWKKVSKISAKKTRACAECHEFHRRCSGGTPCRQCAEKAKRGSICRCHYPPRKTHRVVGEALTSVPESDNSIPSLGGESTFDTTIAGPCDPGNAEAEINFVAMSGTQSDSGSGSVADMLHNRVGTSDMFLTPPPPNTAAPLSVTAPKATEHCGSFLKYTSSQPLPRHMFPLVDAFITMLRKSDAPWNLSAASLDGAHALGNVQHGKVPYNFQPMPTYIPNVFDASPYGPVSDWSNDPCASFNAEQSFQITSQEGMGRGWTFGTEGAGMHPFPP